MKSVKNLFMSLFMFAFVISGSATANVQKKDVPETLAGTTRISAEQLIELLDKHENLVIIDSRKPSDRNKGYIEGSVGLPDTDTSPDSLSKHLKTKTTPVVFFCNGVKCGRSMKASKVAIADGYKNIYWFRGGWAEWTEKNLPVTKD